MTSLNWWENKILDLSPLNSLKSLTSLYLSKNQISDVTPIASLTKLTILELSYNRIPNTDALWAPVHNLPSNPQGKQAWDSIDVRNSQGKTD